MATSTRKKAIELWQTEIPEGDKEKMALTMFCFENPPGTRYVSGSQDALGIALPGANKLYYDKGYWPVNIESVLDDEKLDWLEKRLWMIPLSPRISDFHVLDETNISKEGAKRLSEAAENCWTAFINKDTAAFGNALTDSFDAQVAMFPKMVNEEITNQLEFYKPQVSGYKISGAGGGGYLILFSENEIEIAMQIRIRRKS
jgi:galactokinase/mevalonate kinase-like predicted kinase